MIVSRAGAGGRHLHVEQTFTLLTPSRDRSAGVVPEQRLGTRALRAAVRARDEAMGLIQAAHRHEPTAGRRHPRGLRRPDAAWPGRVRVELPRRAAHLPASRGLRGAVGGGAVDAQPRSGTIVAAPSPEATGKCARPCMLTGCPLSITLAPCRRPPRFGHRASPCSRAPPSASSVA